MNVARPGGNKTELGSFYFCRHPDHLVGMAKSAEAIFVVNVVTGLCTLYKSIKAISATNRTAIRNHLNNGTVHDSYRYVYKSVFIQHFPEASEVDTIQLNKEQLEKAKAILPRTVT